MAVTVSTPVGDGSFVTRKLKWQERLSPAGRIALYPTAAVMGGGLLYWMVKTEGHWGDQWLSMLIAYFAVYWIVRVMLLAIFPRQFPATAPSSPDQTPLQPPASGL